MFYKSRIFKQTNMIDKTELIKILVDWAVTLEPEKYKDTKEFLTIDFLDSPLCVASRLDIEQEVLGKLKQLE